ncbi:MAG TPA: PadR family transcriptional regulator [Thermoanaerobaculia bacterium]|nr:PadR family transcriptional regulator [Thermoanaerobaculia bacterium]
MSLPHVLLGLLDRQPRTGYDLARAIREEMEPVWRAEISQIYPELARLRREGLVVLRVLGPRRGPLRNLYRVTAAGRRELRRWLLEAPPPPRARDDGLARIAFLDSLGTPERRAVLRAYERAVADEIVRLRAAPPLDGFRKEAREGAVEKLEGARRWARALAARPSLAGAADASAKGDRPARFPGKKK